MLFKTAAAAAADVLLFPVVLDGSKLGPRGDIDADESDDEDELDEDIPFCL